MCTYMWRSEVNPPGVFLKSRSLTDMEHFAWTEWQEAKGNDCLCLPSAGIKRRYPQSRSSHMGSENCTQALTSAWKTRHRLNCHSSPFFLNFAQISML